MKHLLYIFFGLAVLLTACDNHYDERSLQLHELQALNRSDSLMTNDSLALALCNYFDRHGTANDRMLAHYLLGRTYADLGQTPQALEAYHDAIDHADTTASDCDFAILGRVYAQMSDIVYMQNLMQDYMVCNEHAINYGWKARDTMMALNETGYRVPALVELNRDEEAIALFDSTFNKIKKKYGLKVAATYCIFPVNSLLRLNRFAEAKKNIDIFEKYSGFFDSQHNITKGREGFYYYKGLYFLKIHENDSALSCFYRTLHLASNVLNRRMATRGLSLAYQQINRPDSAAKYGLLSYELNDSFYTQMATREVEQMQAMYNYSRHQQIAQREHQRAESESRKAQLRLYILIGIVLIAGMALFLLLNKRKKEKQAYTESQRRLEKAVNEVVALRLHAEYLEQTVQASEQALHQQNDDAERQIVELHKIIYDKETEIRQQQKLLAESRHRYVQTKESAEERLIKSETYIYIHKLANVGQKLTDDDWHLIHNMVVETLPRFYQYIISNKYSLNQHEYQACLLFRLHVNALSVSNLLGVSPATITKVSKSILRKLFEKEGNSKDVMEMLSDLC